MAKNKKLRILGICAGNGVNLHPFLQGDYEIIGNIEPRGCYWTKGSEQWKANFGYIPMIKSTKDTLLSDNPDVIIGNPKCGASSILRYSRSKKLGNAKGEPSLDLFIDCVNGYSPKLFMMENLPQLLNQVTKEDFSLIFRDYDLLFHQDSVSAWGNSQKSRVRLVIIGVKKNSSRININQFKTVFPVNELKFTRELLQPLELIYESNDNIFNLRENSNHKVAMYDYRDSEKKTLSLREVRKLWRGDFKDEYKWPIKSKKMHTLPGVYRNRENGYPMTVRKENRQFRWDGKNHTPRELAMIQGFPFSFKLYYEKGNPSRLNYWINKARISIAQSPPYEIGLWLKNCLEQGSKSDKNNKK